MGSDAHYTWLILDQDADGNRFSEARTSATPTVAPGRDAMVLLGPVTVGAGGEYRTDQEALNALAAAQRIALADPETWDALFEETLEDDGTVLI